MKAARLAHGMVAGPLVAAMLVAGGVAHAHHAWTDIDTGKTLELTGTVRSLKWENPHASLVLAAAGPTGPVDWTIEMSGLARMGARGVSADAVAIGKTLSIVAAPARDGSHVARANRIRSDGQDHVLY